ncbi:MAG: cysteine desulfurase [Candidatus Eremiobacteraeota bacterium]|nr:cysteine desulfurase [Candidatus Eremiobacteraeota bacterium]
MSARIYADHAATTPLRAEVLEAMVPYLTDGFNASSLHQEGRRSRRALDDARTVIAGLLGAQAREIVFTSGGSESDNLAIFGMAGALRERGRHVVTSSIEHHAVLHAVDRLRDDGWDVSILPVDNDGQVDPGAFEGALRADTTLATMMLANNEIGTISPIAHLVSIAHEKGVLFHTDAVQAPAYLPINVEDLGVDALSISAHKFYGPKGVGALYLRTGTPLRAQLLGGSQELAKRAGTENVAAIVGMAKALVLADKERKELAQRLTALRSRFERDIINRVPDAKVNAAQAARLPHISNIAFGGIESTALVMRLDVDGAAISAGSACAAGVAQASHVVAALREKSAQDGAVRFSFGRSTTDAEIERLVEMVAQAVRALRETTPERMAGVR